MKDDGLSDHQRTILNAIIELARESGETTRAQLAEATAGMDKSVRSRALTKLAKDGRISRHGKVIQHIGHSRWLAIKTRLPDPKSMVLRGERQMPESLVFSSASEDPALYDERYSQ